MPTTGDTSGLPPIDPKNAADPKLKIPPSAATSQYPRPSGVDAIPTIGDTSGSPPIDPKNAADPKPKTPPSAAASQYPPPSGVAAMVMICAAATPGDTVPWLVASPN